jgi:hypothetical protein
VPGTRALGGISHQLPAWYFLQRARAEKRLKKKKSNFEGSVTVSSNNIANFGDETSSPLRV